MKLNLECHNDLRNGYINIIKHPNLQSKPHDGINITVGDFKNLDQIIDDNSVEEIIFSPLMNVITPNEIPKVLHHWKNKLVVGGVVKISFVDVRRVGQAAHLGQLSLENIHYLILGQQNEFRTVLDIATAKVALNTVNLVPQIINPTDFIVSIEAEKTNA
jgi:hypothetical protein